MLRRWHGKGGGVERPRGGVSEVLDDFLRARDVSPAGPKGLGERSHENVDILKVDAKVLAKAPPRFPQGPDAVGLVQVKIAVVLLLQLHDLL